MYGIAYKDNGKRGREAYRRTVKKKKDKSGRAKYGGFTRKVREFNQVNRPFQKA